MQEFQRNHMRISHKTVHFHRKNVETEIKNNAFQMGFYNCNSLIIIFTQFVHVYKTNPSNG
jgi:hypothetical protein